MTQAAPELMAEVVRLVQRAGDAILSVYGEQFEVTHKTDQSPLTEADLRAHDILVQGLRALTPDVPVFSEPMRIRGDSLLVVPLLVKDEVIGTFTVAAKRVVDIRRTAAEIGVRRMNAGVDLRRHKRCSPWSCRCTCRSADDSADRSGRAPRNARSA